MQVIFFLTGKRSPSKWHAREYLNIFVRVSVNLVTENWLKTITDIHSLPVVTFGNFGVSFFPRRMNQKVFRKTVVTVLISCGHWCPRSFFRLFSFLWPLMDTHLMDTCKLICLLVMIHLCVQHLPHCRVHLRLVWPILLCDRLKHQTRCGCDYILKKRRMIPFSLSSPHVTVQSWKDALPSISNFQANQ